MAKDKTPKPSMFQRMQGGKQPKPSVFTRIKIGGKSTSSSTAQDENSVFNNLGEVNEVQSSISSCIKCIAALDIKNDGSLKVKRCSLLITSCDASSNSKDKIKDEEQASSHLVTIWEADDLEDKTELAKVQKIQKIERASSMSKWQVLETPLPLKITA